ncbi:hypothetical protein P8452_56918 [Trifolium repens]|nr:hypothetical protein P8452_56918 [Trifolium repens]
MLPIVVIDPRKSGISVNYFPCAFDSVVGKSIMLIVEKKKHDTQYCDEIFEFLCVSDDPKVIEFMLTKEFVLLPLRELLAEYLNPLFVISQQLEVGESSSAARANSTDNDPELRSVRTRLA